VRRSAHFQLVLGSFDQYLPPVDSMLYRKKAAVRVWIDFGVLFPRAGASSSPTDRSTSSSIIRAMDHTLGESHRETQRCPDIEI